MIEWKWRRRFCIFTAHKKSVWTVFLQRQKFPVLFLFVLLWPKFYNCSTKCFRSIRLHSFNDLSVICVISNFAVYTAHKKVLAPCKLQKKATILGKLWQILCLLVFTPDTAQKTSLEMQVLAMSWENSYFMLCSRSCLLETCMLLASNVSHLKQLRWD